MLIEGELFAERPFSLSLSFFALFFLLSFVHSFAVAGSSLRVEFFSRAVIRGGCRLCGKVVPCIIIKCRMRCSEGAETVRKKKKRDNMLAGRLISDGSNLNGRSGLV